MFVLTVREKYIEKNRDLEIVSLMSVVYSETFISKWNPQTLAFESRVYLVHRKSLFKGFVGNLGGGISQLEIWTNQSIVTEKNQNEEKMQ